MAIKVKNKFIKEDILDENGNKLGEIKFNPDDSRIMNKLTKIVNDLSKNIRDIKKIGKIPEIKEEDLETIEDFEKTAEIFEKMQNGFDIELQAVESTIKDLNEVFGEETISLFTQGTKDITCVMPLIEFVMPYVKESRSKKVNKYLSKKSNSDVME